MSERLRIIAKFTGGKSVQKDIQNIGSAALRSGGSVDILNRSLRGLGAAFIIRQLVKTADSFTLISNRLAVATATTGELTAVTQELLQVSRETRTSFEANAELFQRFRAATDGLGLSNERLLKIINSINQAVTISGVTSVEAAQALRQLSQGIGSSELRGQELRSVLEQLPKVADVIAERFDVTRAALLRIGQDGKIGAREVIEAFEEAADKLGEEFAEVVPTIGQSFTVLSNEFTFFIGQLNKSTGVFTAISKTILLIADNFDVLGRVVAGLAPVFGVLLTSSIFRAIKALKLFNLALLSNPITAVLVLITVLITTLIAFSDRIRVSTDDTLTLGNVFQAAFELASEAFAKFVDFVKPGLDLIQKLVKSTFGDIEFSLEGILKFTAFVVERQLALFVALVKTVPVLFKGLVPAVAEQFVNLTNFIIDQFEKISDFLQALGESIIDTFSAVATRLNIVFRSLGEAARQSLAGNFEEAGQFANDAIFQLEQAGKEFGKFGESFNRNLTEAVEDRTIPQVANAFKGAGKKLGIDTAETFLKTFKEFTPLQDVVDTVFGRAREIQAREVGAAPSQVDEIAREQEALKQEFDIEEVLIGLDAQIEALGRSSFARKLESQFIKIQNDLKKKGVDLSKAEFAEKSKEIMARLESVALAKEEAKLVESVIGRRDQQLRQLEQLIKLQEEAGQKAFLFNQAIRDTQNAIAEQEQSISGGFTIAFNKLADSATNFASITENLLTNAFGAAEDAFVDFVKTGEFNFSKLVDSILEDLARLAIKQALFGLLTAGGAGGGFGQGGIATGSQFLFGRQAGGPVSRGVPTIVGERGPEVFMPTSSGNILPNAAATAPEVNVRVVNVTDPEEIAGALSGPAGEQAIINVLRRNRRTVRTMIGT